MKKILGMMLLIFLVIIGSVVLVGKWVNSGYDADPGTGNVISIFFANYYDVIIWGIACIYCYIRAFRHYKIWDVHNQRKDVRFKVSSNLYNYYQKWKSNGRFFLILFLVRGFLWFIHS